MIRALYSLVVWLAQPLLRAKLRRRAVAEPGYGVAVDERFGHYTQTAARADDPSAFIWVHAVSLGETRAAAAFISQLRQHIPGMRLLLTHGTATGRAQGLALLQHGDEQVWQPWDAPGAVARFLAHFKPRIGLLVETEVWPNMVACCARAGVPLCLVNARLSAKSLRQAQQWSWLAYPAYAGLRAVWAQTQEDAVRLQAVGARVAGVMGNFKFDVPQDARQLAQGTAWRKALARPVVLFASSREGEEAMLLEALARRQAVGAAGAAPAGAETAGAEPQPAPVQWLIVPRHPQRFDAVAQQLLEAGWSLSRRSQWREGPQDADIWLGDSLGEMAMYLGLADVALLGGSFAPLGGQNLIEAAACGCPVVMGPHTFNFEQAALLARDAGAAFEVPDMAAAIDKALQLVRARDALEPARQAALALGQAHRGAALRTAQAVRALLPG